GAARAGAGLRARWSSHGAITSEWASFAATMIATNVSSSGRRVSSSSSLRMFCTVLKPISGRNSAKAMRAVSKASFSARPTSRRPAVDADAGSAISDLLHFRTAEQALRQEDERDREDREGGDVLV